MVGPITNYILNDIGVTRVANWKATNKDKLGEFTALVRLGLADDEVTIAALKDDISAGIADGLKNYDWSGDATTLATDLETAIRNATRTHSPSQMTVPISQGITEGIGRARCARSARTP